MQMTREMRKAAALFGRLGGLAKKMRNAPEHLREDMRMTDALRRGASGFGRLGGLASQGAGLKSRSPEELREHQRAAGRARWAGMTAEQRTEAMRRIRNAGKSLKTKRKFSREQKAKGA